MKNQHSVSKAGKWPKQTVCRTTTYDQETEKNVQAPVNTKMRFLFLITRSTKIKRLITPYMGSV